MNRGLKAAEAGVGQAEASPRLSPCTAAGVPHSGQSASPGLACRQDKAKLNIWEHSHCGGTERCYLLNYLYLNQT